MLIPLVAAAVALVVALACYAMVKFYGVVFLGQPREEKLLARRTTPPAGSAWAWRGSRYGRRAMGLFPIPLIDLARPRDAALVGSGLAQTVHANGWLLLSPIGVERASYSPLVFLAGVVAGTLLGLIIARRLYRGTLRRAQAWACGYSGSYRPHAGHRRGIRPADTADLRALLPHHARIALAL
jgi:hydrogenase-4 component B